MHSQLLQTYPYLPPGTQNLDDTSWPAPEKLYGHHLAWNVEANSECGKIPEIDLKMCLWNLIMSSF